MFVDFQTGSSEEKLIFVNNEINKYAVIAALSSTLWFWYFTLTSDCRHLGNRDIATFPLTLKTLNEKLYNELIEIGKLYVEDLKKNAEKVIRVYKEVKPVDVISFRVIYSKPIIDDIDRVLAKHYGFTEEELDYIINYDIKYRMGLAGESREEE